MSLTGLTGYCWAGAPPHSTMEMSPSATANSLCMPFSSNDVAGKVYPNCRGKLVLATDSISTRRSLEESFEGRGEVRGQIDGRVRSNVDPPASTGARPLLPELQM